MVDEIRRKRNNNNRNRGKLFEKKVADLLGFFRVPYSGTNDTFGWGDVRSTEDQSQSRYLGECKSITPRSIKEINYSIKEDWLTGKNGILGKAKNAGDKIPFLAFTKVRSPLIYIILQIQDFKMLIQALEILIESGAISDTTNRKQLTNEVQKLYESVKGVETHEDSGHEFTD